LALDEIQELDAHLHQGDVVLGTGSKESKVVDGLSHDFRLAAIGVLSCC
jgi:hypothetical protein